MTFASLEKFNVAKNERKMQEEDDDVSLSDSGRSVLFGNTLKKLKAKKMYSEDVRHVKNLKCCAGSTTSLCDHLRSYHPKICKKAEDKIKRRSSKKT